MRFRRRRPPQLNPKYLVQTSGIERQDRAVPLFETTTLSGQSWSSAELASDRPTLLVFVKSDCLGCTEFLTAAADPIAAGLVEIERLILVVDHHDRDILEPLADNPALEALLVGPEAARALRVPGAPFFSLIAASGAEMVSEGVAFGVSQVRDHCHHGLAGMDQSVPRLEPGD